VEGVGGAGHLLAQQLVAAGERVLGVQPKLGARVRLLAMGATNNPGQDSERGPAAARDHVQPLSLLRNGISGHLGPPHATLEE
jgi:hypothetical protein